MIRVGTSGFSYVDWRGPFYPPDRRPAEFLAYYAARFDACELNFTYYRMPDARTLDRMVVKSEGRVEFTLKAFQAMTHSRDAPPEDVAAFTAALAPLREAGVFGGLLLQFPFSFKREAASEAYLESLAGRLREGWAEIPLVVEFRHRSWVAEDAYAWLRARALGFCCVDEPQVGNLMPPVAVSTGPLGYVRFHGRNAQKWWRHEKASERYDYLYSDEELLKWLPRIRALESACAKTFVFFNNHFQAKAAVNAHRLLELLRDAPEPPAS
jgi:uncharacterized protein YecE (DUF72 family)